LSLEKESHVKIKTDILVHNSSIFLDEETSMALKNIGESLGLKSLVMESGAGHDVMNMSRKWPSGLVFIKCRDGVSHHPEEYASLEDLSIGVEILVGYLRNEARNG